MIKDLKVKISYDIDELKAGSAEWKRHNDLVSGAAGDFRKVNDAGSQATKSLKSGVDDVSTSTSKMGGIVKSIGPQILAAFSIGAVIGLGKEVYNVTAKFQTMAAVLTNTLGSSSAAQKALADIKNFAAVTPFSVDQLTESYVKLANQGFTPTVNQLRQLGDLASSTGKGFDQLSEAILDAQTGEFERLKEFGIKASKNGDLLSFSFKGVKTEVDNTSAAIQNYILGLGDLEGVTGAMAAISETAAGQVSNLGDKFDSLLNTIGSAQSGVFAGFVTGLGDVIDAVERLAKTSAQRDEEINQALINNKFNDQLKEIEESLKGYTKEVGNSTKDVIAFYKAQLVEEQRFAKENAALLVQAALNEAQKQGEIEKGRNQGEVNNARRIAKEAENEKRRRMLFSEASDLLVLEIQNRLKTLEKAEADAADKQLKDDDKLNKERLKKAKELTKALEDERRKGFAAQSGDTGQVDDLDKFEADKKRREKANDEKREVDKRFLEETTNSADQFVKDHQAKLDEEFNRNKARREKELEDIRQKEEAKQKIMNASANLIQGIGSAFFQIGADQRNAQLQDIQTKQAQELKLAGDNKQQQEIINNKYAAKERQLKRQQAQADKDQAIFNILLNTAVGVTKALGSAPPPANFVLAALVGALGGVQLIAASSKPLPKFKRGTKSVPGVDTGEDTVLAMLRPKEKVFSVETSQKYTPALDAIFDHKVSAELINSFVLDQNKFNRSTVVNNSFADPELKKEIQGLRNDIRNKKEVHVSIDKNGLKNLLISSNNKTEYLNNYFTA